MCAPSPGYPWCNFASRRRSFLKAPKPSPRGVPSRRCGRMREPPNRRVDHAQDFGQRALAARGAVGFARFTMIGDGDCVLEEDRQELPPAGRRHARWSVMVESAHQIDGRNIFDASAVTRRRPDGVVKFEGDAVVHAIASPWVSRGFSGQRCRRAAWAAGIDDKGNGPGLARLGRRVQHHERRISALIVVRKGRRDRRRVSLSRAKLPSAEP